MTLCHSESPLRAVDRAHFEDIEAVIQMIIKGKSPNMRHVSGTHRVDCGFFFLKRVNDDPTIFIRLVKTKDQMADILTKSSFIHTFTQWTDLKPNPT